MTKSILMCPPTFFDIEYEINPWMKTTNQVDPDKATAQWEAIKNNYINTLGCEVKIIDPVKGLPDMVFTANGALVIGKKVALPTFRAPDRQLETEYFHKWFTVNGFETFLFPKYDFEGEGDALVWNDLVFAGYPWRSDLQSHNEIADFFGCQVVSLQLTDARFYHLDTCLTIIDKDTVAIWPAAFTEESIEKIHKVVPTVVEANQEDALAYGLNAMSVGNKIMMSHQAHHLIATYQSIGKEIVPVDISEYKKSGGGVKCLTLILNN